MKRIILSLLNFYITSKLTSIIFSKLIKQKFQTDTSTLLEPESKEVNLDVDRVVIFRYFKNFPKLSDILNF